MRTVNMESQAHAQRHQHNELGGNEPAKCKQSNINGIVARVTQEVAESEQRGVPGEAPQSDCE